MTKEVPATESDMKNEIHDAMTAAYKTIDDHRPVWAKIDRPTTAGYFAAKQGINVATTAVGVALGLGIFEGVKVLVSPKPQELDTSGMG